MICDIVKQSEGETIFRPTFASPIDSNELNDMLIDSFPYNNNTYHLGLWDFHLCCWNGYDNAIVFR